MPWVIPALLAPAVWAISNLIDSRLIRGQIVSPVTLTAIAGLMGAVPALISSGGSDVGAVGGAELVVGAFAGIIALFSFYPYYRALESEHPASAVLLWNAAPVVVAVLARIFLGERLGLAGWTSAGLLVGSSLVVSLPAVRRRTSRQAIGWMAVASISVALEAVLQRWLLLRLPVESAITIMYGAGACAALCILGLRSKCRAEFAEIVRRRAGAIVLANEALNILGGLASTYAVALGSVGLVKAVGGLQPLFVVALGAALAALGFRKPRTAAESPRLAVLALASALAIAGLALVGSG